MQDLSIHLKNNLGLVAIAVGYAEGTRQANGAFTEAFWGHTDPGNGHKNLGSFSYQGTAAGPSDADNKQLYKLMRQLLPKFEIKAPNHLYTGKEAHRLLLFVSACDCFVQSETACCGELGFLDLIAQNPNADIVEARVQAYYDPDTHQLDAPGFGNSIERLRADQARRQKCIEEVVNGHQ